MELGRGSDAAVGKVIGKDAGSEADMSDDFGSCFSGRVKREREYDSFVWRYPSFVNDNL